MCLCETHKWLVHRYTCMSNTCHRGGNGLDMLQGSHMWWRSSLHETWHGVMWLRWRRSRHDLAWWTDYKREGQVGGFGAMDRVAVKLEQDLAPMDEGNGKKQVKSRSMNQYDHVMIWSGSYHCWSCWCMCCIDIGGDGMECARQRYNLGHFISPVIGV